MERIGIEEMTASIGGQVVTFSNDIFNTNRLPVYIGPESATVTADGNLSGEDMGLTIVSFPIQIVNGLVPDIQLQTPLMEAIYSDGVTNNTVLIDPSQLATLSNGQLVLTEEGLLNTTTTQAILDKDTLLCNTSLSQPLLDHSRQINLNRLDLNCLQTTSAPVLVERLNEVMDAPVPVSINCIPTTLTAPDELIATSMPEEEVSTDILPPIREGAHKCNICAKEFKSWQQYRRHKDTHMDDKPHRCSVCSATFNIPSNLTLHSALHNLDNLECPECLKKFSRLASLKAHIMMHEREESLFCIECGDEFSNQIHLDRHMKDHEDEWVKPDKQMRIYQCSHCDRQYSKLSVLKDHMKEHYKVKESMSARVYKRAIRRGIVLHSCDICQKSFQKPSQLLRHLRIHTGEKPFKCEMCSSAFNQKGSLLIHLASTHKGIKPYNCEFCNAAFSQKGNLRAHVLRLHCIPHSQEIVYRCSDCSCVFRRLGSLNAHMNRVHLTSVNKESERVTQAPKNDVPVVKSSDVSQSKDTSDKENDSKASSELIASKSYITVANKMDDGSISRTVIIQRRLGSVKWHQCGHCSKEFKKPSDLVRHVRIHTREKPYKCKHCSRAFTVRSTLVTHIRTHTGAKNYVCNICNKVYATSSSLKVHRQKKNPSVEIKKDENVPEQNVPDQNVPDQNVPIQNVPDQNVLSTQTNNSNYNNKIEGQFQYEEPILLDNHNEFVQVVAVKNIPPEDSADRPHRCTFCPSSFRKSNHLKVHLRVHTGEKPFKCNICSRSFVSNAILKGHMRTHLNLKKPHTCGDCGNNFSTKGSLRRHMHLHSTTCPYLCPYCNKTFKSHSSCSKHIKTHKLVLTVTSSRENGQVFELQHILANINEEEEIVVNDEIEVTAVEEEKTEELMNESCPVVETVGTLIVNPDEPLQDEPYIIQSVENDTELSEARNNNTLNADSSGTITLPNLAGQEQLSQASMREIEETLNQQLFGAASELGLVVEDKEQSVLFDQGFENCVFSAIGLQNDQLELNQVLTPSNVTSVLPQEEKQDETLYSCDKCDSVFKERDEFEAHKVIHDSSKDKTCSICDKTFQSVASYKLHVKSHGREKEHECHICGARFTLAFSLARHMAIHSEDKTFVCSLCGASYRTEAQLRRHSNEHKEPRSRPRRRRGEARQLTEEETKQLAGQLPHQGISVSERVLIASFAEKDRISDLKDPGEKFEHEPLHPNQCKYCPKSFRKPSDLVRHLRIHTGERPYQCDFCNKCFTVKSTLDSHIKTHTFQKQCTCHVCGSMFTTKGSLKVHMRLHTGSRPFRCPVCDHRFRTSGHRKAHLLSHIREAANRDNLYVVEDNALQIATTDKYDKEEQTISTPELPKVEVNNEIDAPPTVNVFVCAFCNKIFYKNSALTRHTRVHTGEKPYKCKMCNKTFSQKNSLQIHYKHHTGERPWQCPECSMSFSQKETSKHTYAEHISFPSMLS